MITKMKNKMHWSFIKFSTPSVKKSLWRSVWRICMCILGLNPFAPGDFAEKRVLKLVEWFSGHCRAIKS